MFFHVLTMLGNQDVINNTLEMSGIIMRVLNLEGFFNQSSDACVKI